jgi:tetratricopeptide (TPR) repeat protein
VAEAEKLIAQTPEDCDECMRDRAWVAAAQRDWAEMARDFSVVGARSPHIPFAEADWGEILLRKGDYDAAIAKFKEANAKSPHFADPLEMWGEALIAKNRSDLALAKFEEADKNAPNWGRLHLKWGEALFYMGKPEESKRQFAIAANLDLSPADKASFASWMKAHG